MDCKSNITVASNIYPRVHPNVQYDPHFVASVHGHSALKKLEKLLFGTFAPVKLSKAQHNELRKSYRCASKYNYLKEMTHGLTKREKSIVWSCRCENVKCKNYSSCMPVPLVRTLDPDRDTDTAASPGLAFEWLGDVEQILTPPGRIEESLAMEEEPIPQEFTETPGISDDYIVLDSPARIIEADIASQILVNAGPGTGKTYTVIERLAHLIHSGEVDLGQVLVLCYTNAARDVILSRLEEKGLGQEAQQLVVCTLDSEPVLNKSPISSDISQG